LKIGDKMNEENSDYQWAMDRALRILERRDHAVEELRQKLVHPLNKHYQVVAEDVAQAVIEHLIAIDYLNDDRYVERFGDFLARKKSLSLVGLRHELRLRGVDNETIEKNLPRIDERAQALRLLRRNYANKLNNEKGVRAAWRSLSRRGYPSDVIRDVIQQCCEEAE
jgi:SOS response regulatory protein OraA/RecX